jgi:acetyl-CoA carboxylase beta subunit
MVDVIVDRREMKNTVNRILRHMLAMPVAVQPATNGA